MRSVPLGTLVLLCILAFRAPAGAAVWFSDSFDSYASASLSGQGGWTGNTGVQVQSGFAQSGKAVSGNYMAQFVGDTTHATNSGAGYHTIDLDVAMDTAGAPKGTKLGYVMLRSSAGEELTTIYLSHQQLKVSLDTADLTVIQDDTLMRTWYNVRLGIDLVASKVHVWVNGVRKVENGDLCHSGASIGSIVVGEWNMSPLFIKALVYVDNIVADSSESGPPAAQVLAPAGGWENNHVCCPYVVYDSGAGNYKMFYSGTGGAELNESAWSQWMTGMVTSTDSIAWTRRTETWEPVLYAKKFYEGDLVDPQQSAGVFDSIFAIAPSVIKDGSVYKMWYTGWGGQTEHIGGGLENKINMRIGYATSTDPWTWTKYDGSAGAHSVLGLGAPGEADSKGASDPCVLKEGSTYRMWYDGFDGTTCRIMYATSTDGTTWTKQGAVLAPGAAGSLDSEGCTSPVVVVRGGQYELWYTGKGTSAPYYRILRAVSPNGLSWTKLPGSIDLLPDDTLSGDEKVHVGSVLAQPDGSAWIFYAKENTTAESLTYATVYNKQWVIYRKVVTP